MYKIPKSMYSEKCDVSFVLYFTFDYCEEFYETISSCFD